MCGSGVSVGIDRAGENNPTTARENGTCRLTLGWRGTSSEVPIVEYLGYNDLQSSPGGEVANPSCWTLDLEEKRREERREG
jgi:hypothetical protein